VTGPFAADEALDGVLPRESPPRFTYASDEVGRVSQHVIRLVERCTGQPRIRRMYEDYVELRRPPRLFWQDAIAALALDLRLNREPSVCVPATGALVIVANHPFGVVDGLVLGWMVAQVRSDFQIMTHRILHQAREVRPHILPVDFSGTPEATTNNVRSRRQARELLDRGGALIVFPAGGVAAAASFTGPAVERPWGTLAAKLVLATGAAALPVFFGGQNSRLFQIAAQIHQTLRYALLFHEVRNKIGVRLAVSIGDVITNERLRALPDHRTATEFLRQAAHALAADSAACDCR
jgi:putative hemolysin